MRKDTNDTRWVASPTRQRPATGRKRALRSRTARSARSVCSEYRSRVIEPRKFDDCRGLPDRVKGDSTAAAVMVMAAAARSGSESGAEVYEGIPETCEDLFLPVVKESRIGAQPSENGPGQWSYFAAPSAAKPGKETGNRHPSSRQGCRQGMSGRLSRLIVAFESRVTLLRRSL
jgi:hypothetical protein